MLGGHRGFRDFDFLEGFRRGIRLLWLLLLRLIELFYPGLRDRRGGPEDPLGLQVDGLVELQRRALAVEVADHGREGVWRLLGL